ncbi:hypothetical protein G6F65_020144 [Rhizopus arrhizus]|nr:hypothetical protein G6F65_020144 [Rhizopus arrhizus]
MAPDDPPMTIASHGQAAAGARAADSPALITPPSCGRCGLPARNRRSCRPAPKTAAIPASPGPGSRDGRARRGTAPAPGFADRVRNRSGRYGRRSGGPPRTRCRSPDCGRKRPCVRAAACRTPPARTGRCSSRTASCGRRSGHGSR